MVHTRLLKKDSDKNKEKTQKRFNMKNFASHQAQNAIDHRLFHDYEELFNALKPLYVFSL